MSPNPTRIFITGDIAMDYFLIRGKRFYSDDPANGLPGTHFAGLKGGAHIIFEFLKEISKCNKTDRGNEPFKIDFGYRKTIFDILPDQNKSYAAVSQYEKEKRKVWRIEEFLGFGDQDTGETDLSAYNGEINPDSDIYIIDDAGLEYATSPNKEAWQKLREIVKNAKERTSPPLVICKKSGDIDDNGLFGELLLSSSKKEINLLTILSIHDIRKLDVKVSSGLSWEQSAFDLAFELKNNESLKGLSKSTYLVITFQSSGALFVANDGNNNIEYSLVFDPEKMEGEDEVKGQGRIIGRMSFFTAALVSKLNLAKKNKHYLIIEAIKAGLTAVRLFYETGYICEKDGIKYPFTWVAEALRNMKDFKYSSAFVPDPAKNPRGTNRDWSILLDNYSERQKDEKVEMEMLTALAKNIVMKGPGILKNIPCGRFGDIFTVDRNEIESLRNLKKIMETYVQFDDGKKPLSIAVFGPPGSGKSFAVKEIGKGIMGNSFQLVEFNLSQFSGPEDLIGALHQVRDFVLRKKIPVVFWDEFDSKSYFWLQYLLAPMQDGAFQEGQITHPVGKCIFVFAGGTSYNMNSFGKFKKDEDEKDFILKKGPDFISRLNGYINILGPNRRQKFNPDYKLEDEKWIDDPTDLCFPVRRAIFIITLLHLKKEDFPFKMDWGLLNALIKVERYKHGSRSLANLLTDIRQNNTRNQLLRSWLPEKPTLELYFKDPDNFYSCMKREVEFLEMAYEIAPLIHSYWMDKINDPFNQYSVEYSFLPGFIKESNVRAAKRIPEVLKAGGFILTAKDAPDVLNEKEYLTELEKNDWEILERMAEKEHELWKEFYKECGWEFAEIRNDYAKKHPCYVPYNKLPDNEKDKDREIISRYPIIVEKAGFGILKG
jgi:hypothetical protein